MTNNETDWTLGFKLNKLRISQGSTLKEAAEAIGVSSQFISAVEKGRSGISLNKLRLLLRFYGTTIAESLSDSGDGELVYLEDAEPYETGDAGVYSAFLLRNPEEKQLEPLYYRLNPGSQTSKETHQSAEFLFILSGAIDLTVENIKTGIVNTYHMVKGDSIYIDNMCTHQTRCSGTQVAEILAIAPPRVIERFEE